MSNSISLTASMRSNLLSLQNIAGQVDLTQNRLSTGLKVNSAIDNPSSYYTAVSLNNRASDLSALLDSMAQGIQTIKAATEGLEAGAKLLEQASATATQALETVNIPSKSWFEGQEGVVAVVSTWEELESAVTSGKQGDIVIYGQINCQNSLKLKEGQNLVGVGYYGIEDSECEKFSKLNFDFQNYTKGIHGIEVSSEGSLISDLSLSTAFSKNTNGGAVVWLGRTSGSILQNLDIKVDTQYAPLSSESGGYHISMVRGSIGDSDFELRGINNFYSSNERNISLTGIRETSFIMEGHSRLNMKLASNRGYGVYNTRATIRGDASVNIEVKTRAFEDCQVAFENNSKINIKADRAFSYGSYRFDDRVRMTANVNVAFFSINSGNYLHLVELEISSPEVKLSVTAQNLINNSVDDGTAVFSAVAGSQISWNNKLYTLPELNQRNDLDSSSFQDLDPNAKETVTSQFDSAWLSVFEISAQAARVQNAISYENIIKQYDSLIKDSSYKGINLLRGQDLMVTFNENRSAQLSVQSKDAAAKALGLVTTDWQNQGDVVKSIQELTAALNQIRQMSSELGNYYSIVTTRENFTQNLINVLTEGADKLTLADINEESANMLALQTRQQLAVNSLSLASQASQSILKLF